jgi:hypothetical protein
MVRGRRANAADPDAPAPAPAPIARRRNARGVAGPTSALTSFLRVGRTLSMFRVSADRILWHRNMVFNQRDLWNMGTPLETPKVPMLPMVLLVRAMLQVIQALVTMIMEVHTRTGIRNPAQWKQDRVLLCMMMIFRTRTIEPRSSACPSGKV